MGYLFSIKPIKDKLKVNVNEIKLVWKEIKPIVWYGFNYAVNHSFSSITQFMAYNLINHAGGNLERLFYLCLLDYLFIVLYDNMQVAF